MKPDCPDCRNNKLVEYSGEHRLSESGEMYYVKVYKCHSCDCEFTEEDEGLPITEQWDRDEGDNAWCLPEDMGSK